MRNTFDVKREPQFQEFYLIVRRRSTTHDYRSFHLKERERDKERRERERETKLKNYLKKKADEGKKRKKESQIRCKFGSLYTARLISNGQGVRILSQRGLWPQDWQKDEGKGEGGGGRRLRLIARPRTISDENDISLTGLERGDFDGTTNTLEARLSRYAFVSFLLSLSSFALQRTKFFSWQKEFYPTAVNGSFTNRLAPTDSCPGRVSPNRTRFFTKPTKWLYVETLPSPDRGKTVIVAISLVFLIRRLSTCDDIYWPAFTTSVFVFFRKRFSPFLFIEFRI